MQGLEEKVRESLRGGRASDNCPCTIYALHLDSDRGREGNSEKKKAAPLASGARTSVDQGARANIG